MGKKKLVKKKDHQVVDVFVIRHGQAEHNVIKHSLRKRNIRDPKLTESGRRNVKLIKIMDVTPDIMFVSPLKRTIETALLIHEGFQNKIPMILHADLQEIRAGKYPCDTGSDPKVLSREFPELDFSDLDREWFYPKLNTKERVNRFYSYLAKFLGQEKDGNMKTVCIVCHHGVIREMFGLMVKNCQVVRAKFKNEKLHLVGIL